MIFQVDNSVAYEKSHSFCLTIGISYVCKLNLEDAVMAGNRSGKSDKRGLASADEKTKARVAKMGGEAYHEKRGQKGSDSRRTTE